jgi:hypothetical protein
MIRWSFARYNMVITLAMFWNWMETALNVTRTSVLNQEGKIEEDKV